MARMTKNYGRARVTVKVPARKWKSKAEVEEWARELLAGGPPKLKATIPVGHDRGGQPAEWKDVQKGLMADQYVEIFSDPPGLIVTDSETGDRKFVPSASKTGLVLGKTSAEDFIESIGAERELRDFVKQENEKFNKYRQSKGPTENVNWAWEWYVHGKRIREFVSSHSGVSTERVWRELVNWGLGLNGYGRQTHQDSTYFYDWIGQADISNPVFLLSTTRIQHILRDRTKSGRDCLLNAIITGPFRDFTDDEFAWLIDQRRKNWPLDELTRLDLVAIGAAIRKGLSLSPDELGRLQDILGSARKACRASVDSQEASTTAE